MSHRSKKPSTKAVHTRGVEGGEVQRGDDVNPEIRRPLMKVGNRLGAANAYMIILTMIGFAVAEAFLSILCG